MANHQPRRGRPPKVLDPTATPATHLAAEVRRRRLELGFTQAEVAELIGCGRSTFAQLEEAEGEPSFSLLAACDVVLGAGGAIAILFPSVLIGAAIHRDYQAQARRLAQGLPSWPAQLLSCDKLGGAASSIPAVGSPATNRRHALRYTLGAPLVVAGVDRSALFGPDWFPMPSERLAKAIEHPRRLDTAVLDELAATNARNKRLDDQLGTRVILGPVMAHLALVRELLRGSVPLELRPRLASIAAEAGQEAAFVWRDQQQFGVAGSHYRQAAEIAGEAEDTLLEAYILGNRSRMLIERDNAAQALVVIDGARG